MKCDFQDGAGELIDLSLGVCGGEFIDPEDWSTRSI
jgi:hypothetical protein